MIIKLLEKLFNKRESCVNTKHDCNLCLGIDLNHLGGVTLVDNTRLDYYKCTRCKNQFVSINGGKIEIDYDAI